MTCFVCKGNMEKRLVPHTVEVGNSIIVIKNVPAMVCETCGMVWYNGTVVRQLESIIAAVSQNIKTEVAVVNYADNAA